MFKKTQLNQSKSSDKKRKIKDGPVSDLYPLLSDYQIKNHGLPEGIAGEFTVQSDICGGIATVLEGMYGRTDHRASIPHVYSQQKAFQVTIGGYDPSYDAPEAMKPWRGALALMLLYPFLFLEKQMPVWRTNHDSFQDGNIFSDVLKSFLSREESGVMDQFTALCAVDGNHVYPLLQADKQCLAVPAAYGIESRYLTLPWLTLPEGQPTQSFTDPIEHLGQTALRKLQSMLESLCDHKKCSGALPAVKAYCEDIRYARKRRLAKPDKGYSVEITLLKALLLRNAIVTDIHVIRRSPASLDSVILGEDSVSESSMASELLKDIFPKEEHGKYSVVLGDKLVAHIDMENLLWCPTPYAVAETEEYNDLKAALDNALNNKLLRRLLVYQVKTLYEKYKQPNNPLLAAIKQELGEEFSRPILEDLSIPWALTCIIPGETDFDEIAFHSLQLKSFAKGDPDTFFADQLMGIEADDIDSALERLMISESNNEGMPVMYFRPLGAYGGMVYSARRNRHIKMRFEHPDTQQIKVVVEARENHILYTQEKIYTSDINCQIMPNNNLPFPSIGIWPNIDDSLRKQWKAYYAIISFSPSRFASLFDTDVYDIDGNKVSDTKKTSHGETLGELYRRWQVFDVGNQPSFALFKYKGTSVGTISLESSNADQFGTSESNGKLCVDFGTTSTMGILRKDHDDKSIQMSLEDTRLEWILNEIDGRQISTRVFINTAFALWQAHGCALFSLFQTFPPEQDNGLPTRNKDVCSLHLDGNMYFLANDAVPSAQNDRIQTRMKTKLLSSDNTARYVFAYLRQIFQFYFLRCRLEQVTSVTLHCAYPLAFQEKEKELLRSLFEKAANTASAETGVTVKSLIYKSESLAVGQYFAHRNALTALDVRKGIMVLDIGGGTSDFSFSINRPGTNDFESLLCSSCHLAGWKMLSQFIQHCIRNGSITDFIDDLRTINIPDRQNFMTRWLDQLRLLSVATENLDSIVTLCMDQFMKQNNDVLRVAFDSGRCVALRENLTLCLGLLFWLARLIYAEHTLRHAPAAQVNRMDLCLAGNGSILYRILPDDVCMKLQRLVSATRMTVTVEDAIEEQYKTEVAEGLIYVHASDNDSRNSNRVLNADDTCDDFLAFMTSYIHLFPDEQPSLRMQRLIDGADELSVFKAELKKHAVSMQMLSRYLPTLADKFNGI